MTTKVLLLLFLCLVCLGQLTLADLPVHCVFDQVKGVWRFQLSKNDFSKDTANCEVLKEVDVEKTMVLDLQEPNIVSSQTGEKGTWTLIYDQGFEIRISGQSYFAFFNYTKDGGQFVSNCHRTLVGWYHEQKSNPQNWGCFLGIKINATGDGIFVAKDRVEQSKNQVYRNNKELIEEINGKQSSWKAASYPELEGLPMEALLQRIGKKMEPYRVEDHKRHMQKMKQFIKPSPKNSQLPEQFDWRNASGIDFVSPVRNQLSCGSCYAFATMGLFESLVRIRTKNQEQPVFSPQDIVSCSKYSQGCDGGFPFLLGRYANDFGIVEEKCNPYKGVDTPCTNLCPPDARTYGSDYDYVGGYYGACSEEAMMQALYENGPLVIGFEVYQDFTTYKSGVYHHVKTDVKQATEFEEVNHAILLVGWGVENGEKYWTIKNSWSAGWGDNGYAKVRRGTDECGIESLAVSAKLAQ